MKKGFKIEQHKETGKQLFEIKNSLQKLNCDLSKSYPKTSRVVKFVRKTEKAISSLRSKLDDTVGLEHPEIDTRTIYYPGRK